MDNASNNGVNKPLSVPQLATRMGLSRIAVYNRVRKGLIPAQKAGRNYVISAQTARRLLQDEITPARAAWIEATVKRVVREYGPALKLLSQE